MEFTKKLRERKNNVVHNQIIVNNSTNKTKRRRDEKAGSGKVVSPNNINLFHFIYKSKLCWVEYIL
jgi:hypothetical protein